MIPVNGAAIAERRIVSSLLRARAVSPESAAPLESLSWMATRQLARLINAGVVVEVQPGRYHLDTAALADRWDIRRQRVALILMTVVLFAGLLTYYASTHAPR